MKITKSLSTEKELIDEIMKQAEKENRSFSNLVETALIYYINHHSKDIKGENKNDN